MEDVLAQFLSIIYEKNMLQGKYLRKFLPALTETERSDLQRLIEFYRSSGHSIEDIAGCYLFLIQMMMEETIYFVQHGTYRYSTFKEVREKVYFNHEYMTKYMIGVGLSTYLLNTQLEYMRWFVEFIKKAEGKTYLEVGPGHGEYLVKAMKYSSLKYFHAIDLSPTSVNLTKKYTQFCGGGGGRDQTLKIEECNFFDFSSDQKYDVIVMCEVLEHVEDPQMFLRQVAKLSHENSRSYVTTVVDAPTLDHIYHFHTVDEIFDVVKTAGLRVLDYKLVTHNNEPLEKVQKKHRAIIAAMVLGL